MVSSCNRVYLDNDSEKITASIFSEIHEFFYKDYDSITELRTDIKLSIRKRIFNIYTQSGIIIGDYDVCVKIVDRFFDENKKELMHYMLDAKRNGV